MHDKVQDKVLDKVHDEVHYKVHQKVHGKVAPCHALPCLGFTCHARPYFHVSCHIFPRHVASYIFHAMPCQVFSVKIVHVLFGGMAP